ncbi:unnamed protein product [Citrullus colocynthis]|uniref:Uncharacterized protein n=1 Tax=Citrullus colocynthis TaxID=252529 RepID=A0ABP0Z899_9ROSI
MAKKMMAVFVMCILVVAALEISTVAAGEEAKCDGNCGGVGGSPNTTPRKKTFFSRIADKLHLKLRD